ncbi:MAG: MFS transporter [Mycobacterium sp.]
MTEQAALRPPGSRGLGVNAALIIVCQSMQAFAFGAVALFLPLIRADVDITFSQAGSLAAGGTLTYALMQVPAGILADRIDPKILFIVGLVGANVLSLIFAMLDDYEALLVNQAASGVCRALVFVPGLILMQGQFRSDRKAMAMGLYVAGGFSSNILLNAFGPLLVGSMGWRWLFVVFSISGLLVLIMFAGLGDSGRRRPHAETPAGVTLVTVLRHPVVWLTGFIQFVRLAVATGTAFWLPSLIVEDKGYSLLTAGVVVAVAAVLTAPSNIIGGVLFDRLDRPLAVIASSLCVMTATLAAIPHVDQLAPLAVLVAANAVCNQLFFGPLFALPPRLLGSENTGMVSGFGNLCANLGGFAFSFGLGAIKDATGSFDVGLYVLAGLCVAGMAATATLTRQLRPLSA